MASPPLGDDPRSGFGWNVNQYLNQYISLADTKVSLLVTADLAIIVLLLPNKPPASPLFFPIFYWLALTLLMLSTIAGFITFYPRVAKKDDGGLLFWRSILSYDGYNGEKGYKGYQKALQDDLTESSKVEDEYARENYHLSKVLKRKNKAIQVSIICFGGGLLCALASTGLSFIMKQA